MTHTAGFSGDLGGMDEEPISRDDLVAKVLAAPLASTPGERFEYSNEGFSLAGAIVERRANRRAIAVFGARRAHEDAPRCAYTRSSSVSFAG